MQRGLWKSQMGGLLGIELECEDFFLTLDNQVDKMTHCAHRLVSFCIHLIMIALWAHEQVAVV